MFNVRNPIAQRPTTFEFRITYFDREKKKKNNKMCIEK